MQKYYTQKTNQNASKIPVIKFIGFSPDVSHKDYERWIAEISQKKQKQIKSEEPNPRWWELEEEEPEYHHPFYYCFNKFHYEELYLEDNELPPDNAIAIYEDNEERYFIRIDDDQDLLPQEVERTQSECLIYESDDYYCSRDGKVYERHENRGWRDKYTDIAYLMVRCKVTEDTADSAVSMIYDIADNNFERNYWKNQLIADWQAGIEEIKRLHIGLQIEDDDEDAWNYREYLDFETYTEDGREYDFQEEDGYPTYGWHQLKSWHQLELEHERQKQAKINKLHPFAKKVYERLIEVEELTKVIKAKLAKCMNRHQEVPVKDWIFIWSIWRELEYQQKLA